MMVNTGIKILKSKTAILPHCNNLQGHLIQIKVQGYAM